MPAKYEAIRDDCVRKRGKRYEKLCKEMAARIYNSQRKAGEAPVTGRHRP